MIHTKATRAHLSKIRKGKNNPFFGRTHTQESKDKMAKWTMERNLSMQYEIRPVTIKIPSSNDLYYLAGIIDGEGSIRFAKGRPFVAVYNGSLLLMKWLVKNVGGTYLAGDNRGRTMNYCWRISAAKDVHHLLTNILNALIIKQDEATEVLNHLRKKYGDRI